MVAAETIILDVEFDRQNDRVSCGAHVLSSVVSYWFQDSEISGQSIFQLHPPLDPKSGYSMAQIIALAREHNLHAFGVRLTEARIRDEVTSGRPVLVPLRAPYVYLQSVTLFDPDLVPVGNLKNRLLNRIGLIHEWTGTNLLDHYVLVVGFDKSKFVLLDPVMGYRTISAKRFRRYRKPFENAAIAFSR